MSAPLKIPMPLRVPELAPSLGRLLVPRRLEPPWVPLDDVREELATGGLELGGEARAAAVREERERVLDAVGRRARLGAWARALRRAARRWCGAVEAVAGWRPPLWPVLARGVPLAAALIWVGLVLGGYLPAPAWLAARLGF